MDMFRLLKTKINIPGSPQTHPAVTPANPTVNPVSNSPENSSKSTAATTATVLADNGKCDSHEFVVYAPRLSRTNDHVSI